MQTFLPEEEFQASARALDMKRLGKQRVEVLQILRALYGIKEGWKNHACTRMWRGHEPWLIYYGVVVCNEWIYRGYKDTCKPKIEEIYPGYVYDFGPRTRPPWLGDPAFHLSHKSNLVRKSPEWYGPMWPDVPPDLPYLWPMV